MIRADINLFLLSDYRCFELRTTGALFGMVFVNSGYPQYGGMRHLEQIPEWQAATGRR